MIQEKVVGEQEAKGFRLAAKNRQRVLDGFERKILEESMTSRSHLYDLGTTKYVPQDRSRERL